MSTELDAPGKAHEEIGKTLILEHGIEPQLARFAKSQGYRPEDPRLELADLLVILADKSWKGKRVQELEERIARELAKATGSDFWAVHMQLSDPDSASSRLDKPSLAFLCAVARSPSS